MLFFFLKINTHRHKKLQLFYLLCIHFDGCLLSSYLAFYFCQVFCLPLSYYCIVYVRENCREFAELSTPVECILRGDVVEFFFFFFFFFGNLELARALGTHQKTTGVQGLLTLFAISDFACFYSSKINHIFASEKMAVRVVQLLSKRYYSVW